MNGLAELAEFAEEFRVNGKEGIAKLTGVADDNIECHVKNANEDSQQCRMSSKESK